MSLTTDELDAMHHQADAVLRLLDEVENLRTTVREDERHMRHLEDAINRTVLQRDAERDRIARARDVLNTNTPRREYDIHALRNDLWAALDARSTPDAPVGTEVAGGREIASCARCDGDGYEWCYMPECTTPDRPDGARDLRCLGCNGTGVEPIDYRAPDTCGDRLTTWHGPIGPCVRTDRHDQHHDGAGITWTRTEVPRPQEEA